MKPDKPYDLPLGSKFTTMTEMKLRDHFAAAALQGVLASETRPFGPLTQEWHAQRAALAYELADAMLAERQRHG